MPPEGNEATRGAGIGHGHDGAFPAEPAEDDPVPGLPYLDSTRRLFDYTHTARLMACGASLVVGSPDELGPALARSFARPGELRLQREKLARQEGYDGAGRASERTAAVLARLAR